MEESRREKWKAIYYMKVPKHGKDERCLDGRNLWFTCMSCVRAPLSQCIVRNRKLQ